MVVGGHLWSLVVVSGRRWSSVVIGGNWWELSFGENWTLGYYFEIAL